MEEFLLTHEKNAHNEWSKHSHETIDTADLERTCRSQITSSKESNIDEEDLWKKPVNKIIIQE